MLSEQQCGFQPKRCTVNALTKVVGTVYNALNEKQLCASVFFDLKKAFDTVSHDRLIEKLHILGFRNITLDFFRSYLQGRTQRTKVENCISEPKSLSWGVLQGSVLGPILFILYMNDIFQLPLTG